MQPHYYLMKSKKILRLEANMSFASLSSPVLERLFDGNETQAMDQNQANWRVVIFRDEIMEYEEYMEWMASPEGMEAHELEIELIAN